MSESLYLSDTNTRKVYKAKSLTETKDLAKNADVVAGTGDQCLPFDQSHCGDGGKASEASLNSPRGKKRPYLGYLLLVICHFLPLFRNSDGNGSKICLWQWFNQLLSQITSWGLLLSTVQPVLYEGPAWAAGSSLNPLITLPCMTALLFHYLSIARWKHLIICNSWANYMVSKSIF